VKTALGTGRILKQVGMRVRVELEDKSVKWFELKEVERLGDAVPVTESTPEPVIESIAVAVLRPPEPEPAIEMFEPVPLLGGWVEWSAEQTDAEGLAKVQAYIETAGFKERVAAQPWLLSEETPPARTFDAWQAVSYVMKSQVVAGMNYDYKITVALTEPIEKDDGWHREFLTLAVHVYEPLSGEAEVSMSDPVMPFWEVTPKEVPEG